MNPSLSADDLSSGELMVDSDEILLDAENEKDDVAIITPDSDTDIEKARPIMANDHATIRDLILTPIDGSPEVLKDGHYVWEIEDWQALPKRAHSEVFEIGGYKWRVLLFPSGNNSDNASMYLEHGYDENKLPEGYVCCAQFGLVLWNPEDPEIYAPHTANHRFTQEEGDWGFTRFVELRKLRNTVFDERGRYLMPTSRRMNVTVFVRIVKDETGVLWHNFNNYDSKKETGFVGLKNQGATCYLNSLIQSLYFTNAFRKAVYQIPTAAEDGYQNSAYTLQRLFYQLQNSNNAVSTNELTKSFGWETRHIFEQQDVQELSRKLMEKMEEKMKGTDAENVLSKLFSGKVRTYISCVNVNYESRRVEDFWDIQLNVSGMKTLEDSFRDYVQVELMDGENQYFAGDQYKLQDAKKGVIFESFPDVLHLQLKRFQYDIERDAMTKLNQYHAYPESFDAFPYLSEDAQKESSESWEYQLHGVLVHSGDLNAGHYYAFIKPAKDGWFYKYDDDRVTKATMQEVLKDNYGGFFMNHAGEPILIKGQPAVRQMNAYMLVYIRKSRVDKVLLPLTIEDTPPHLKSKLEEEAANREARKKERDELHLYLNTKIITDSSFQAYGGTDLTNFESTEEDPAAPRLYKVLRKSTIRELAEKLGHDTKTDPKSIRFWWMVNRQNKTTRPDQPIEDDSFTVEEALHKSGSNKSYPLRLWAELAEDFSPEGQPIWPISMSSQRNDPIVLFLKHFDVENQELRGVGHIHISKEKRVEDLVPAIMKRMNWPEVAPTGEKNKLRLYEEIKPQMIEAMKAKQTLKAAELQNGDIICFQAANDSGKEARASDVVQESQAIDPTSVRTTSERILDAREYYDFLYHRRDIRFAPHPNRNVNPEKLEAFTMVLSSKFNYDKLADKVADRLDVPPTHLRFWTASAQTNGPKTPVKRGTGQTVQTILNPQYSAYQNAQLNDALFYEILEMSLSELDTMKSIKVVWLSSKGTTQDDIYDLLVPRNGVVQDIVDSLLKKAQLDDEQKGGPIRVYECYNSRIVKDPARDTPIMTVTDSTMLVLERVPEDELDPETTFINVFHFQGEPNKTYGVPFRFLIKPDEKFVDTKKRLEKRTGLKGKNFEKVKFAKVKRSMYATPDYLSDDDVLYDIIDIDADALGLDHVDRTRNARTGTQDLFLR